MTKPTNSYKGTDGENCYLVEDIDEIISKGMSQKGFSPARIASIRGQYERFYNKIFDFDVSTNEGLKDAIKEISSFLEKLKNGKKSPVTIDTLPLQYYKRAKQVFSSKQRTDAAEFIAHTFSMVIDQWYKNNPKLPRTSFITGYTHNGVKYFGEFKAFEVIYDKIKEQRDKLAALNKDENKELIDLYSKVLTYYPILTMQSRRILAKTEGMKLGVKYDYAELTNEDNYDVESIELSEEATAEQYQESKDNKSVRSRMSLLTRRVLSNCYQYVLDESGNPVKKMSSMGVPKRMKFNVVQRKISEILRGVESETDMMNRLSEASNSKNFNTYRAPFLAPVVAALRENPRLRTAFYCDFKNVFQPYTGVFNKVDKYGVIKGLAKVLNRISDTVKNNYYESRKLNIKPRTSLAIFKEDGSINIEQLQIFNNRVKEWFGPIDSLFGKNKFSSTEADEANNPKVSYKSKRDALTSLLTHLDIPTSPFLITEIFSHREALKQITKAFEKLAGTSDFSILNNAVRSAEKWKKLTYEEFLNYKRNPEDSTEIKDALDKILEAVNLVVNGERYDRRARFYDRRGHKTDFFSDVLPSRLGDISMKIRNFIEANDKRGLQEWIEKNYLVSSFFKRTDANSEVTILNQWLKDLYDACTQKSNKTLETILGTKFEFNRFLGYDTQPFKNLSDKTDNLTNLIMFFSDAIQRRKKDSAQYPLFILGDSGVRKYIRAGRYSEEGVIKAMINVYHQEIARMRQQKAVNAKLEKEGYNKIANYSTKGENVFTILTFLNEPLYRQKLISKTKNDFIDDGNLADIIKEHLDSVYEDFRQFCDNKGLFETVEFETSKRDPETSALVKETKSKFKYFDEIARDGNATVLAKELKNYVYNICLATINQYELLSIDTAFTKDTEDAQKRFKMNHSNGSAVSVEALDADGNQVGKDNETVIYFDDIIVDSKTIGQEFNKLIHDVFANDPNTISAYNSNNLTDGQGLRSFSSYRDLCIMAGKGKWTDEHEKGYRIIQSIRNKYAGISRSEVELSEEDREEISKWMPIYQPIKPILSTIEHYALTDDDTVLIPVFHKYAEVVLIPELLPKGSMLRDLANYMEENQIDLACAKSAVKMGSYGTVDVGKAQNQGNLNDVLDKAARHKLSYADYRIQTNVPYHVNNSQLVGTQSRKLFFDSIRMDNDYSSYLKGDSIKICGRDVRLTGRNLVSLFNLLNAVNIRESGKLLEEAFKNPNKLSEMLVQGTISNEFESMDNITAYTLAEGLFSLALIDPTLEYNASAMALSILKKVVNKQTIKGGTAVQASAMGLSGYETDGGLKYIYSSDGKNIIGAQCEIPWDLSYTDENGNEIPLNYEQYCDANGELKTDENGNTILEKEFPGILDLVAYRIPTERAYSMIKLKVVRFSNPAIGGIIKVPAPESTKAGFDFDIDKLFLMRKEFIIDKEYVKNKAELKLVGKIFGSTLKWESYDLSKEIEDNSRVARNNLIIDLFLNRLSDPETLTQRMTPGSFIEHSEAADKLKELTQEKKSSKRCFYDPLAMIEINQRNQIADKLIGIFANHNTNHVFSQMLDVFEFKTPIKFAGKSLGNLKSVNEKTDKLVSELLDASVDAVKNPVLNYLGINTLTATTAATLIRVGYTPYEVGCLLNQPIIKEVCQYCFDRDISISGGINAIREKYSESASFDFNTQNDGPYLGELESNLGKKVDNNYQLQANVLQLFEDLISKAQSLSDFVSITKFTAGNAIGSTFGDLYNLMDNVNSFIDNYDPEKSTLIIKAYASENLTLPISNNSSLLSMDDKEYYKAIRDNPFAFEQCMFDTIRKAASQLNRYFPYNTNVFEKSRDTLRELSRFGKLSPETYNSIHREIIIHKLSSQQNSLFYGGHMVNTNYGRITSRDYYSNYFSRDLFYFLESHPDIKEEFPILDVLSLESVEDKQTGKTSYVLTAPQLKELGSEELDEIRDSWEELAEDPEYSDISRDLILYNFFKNGFTFGYGSFADLMPIEVKRNMPVPGITPETANRTYSEFLNEFIPENNKDSKQYFDSEFISLFILNHLDSYEFTLNADAAKLDKVTGTVGDTFTLNLQDLDDKVRPLVQIKSTKESRSFVPVIKHRGKYYMAMGEGYLFNETTSSSMTYKEVKPLGKKGESVQYSYNGMIVDVEGESVESNSNLVAEVNTRNVLFDADLYLMNTIKQFASQRIEVYDTEKRLLSPMDILIELRKLNKAELTELVDSLRREVINGKKVLTLDVNGKDTYLC